MKKAKTESERRGALRSALNVAGFYALFGFLWILFSDRILAVFVQNPEVMTSIQTFKGWLYVAVSAALIYALVQSRVGRIEVLNKSLIQQKAQAQESEKKYRDLFDNLIDVSYRTDLEGVVQMVSPSSIYTFGYTPEEAVGQKITDLYRHPARREEFLALLRIDGQVHDFETEVFCKDGRAKWVSTNARLIYDEEGNPNGVEGITRDVTHLKEAEEEKLQLEETLRQSQKMEAVGTLAGGIAHDFNNILAAIIGYTELERDKHTEDTDSRENLEAVLIAARRASELTKQILLFSRKNPKTREPVSIAKVTAEVLALIKQTIPATITVDARIDEATGDVLADVTELHQVVLNLCTNACHSLPNESGDVHVSLTPVSLSAKQAELHPDLGEGDYALLTVRDDGTGMERDTLSRIFEPFFTTKEQGKGTGMGLAVVHGIVQGCGGAVEVESIPGEGTTFSVYLPLTARIFRAKPAGAAPTATGTERILLVDDEPALANLGEMLLKGLGYTVTATTSPQEALELFKKAPESFDLLVTDQTMPGLTGAALAKEVMRIKGGMPVIICTGHSATIDDQGVAKLGVNKMLSKPYRRDELADAVRSALDGYCSLT